MTTLAKLLGGRRGGVYRLAPAVGAEAVEQRAAAAGLHYVRVDLGRARTKAALLKALGRALEFPEWFGGNWDALADCLADLSWLEAPGWVVMLDDVEGLAGAAGADLAKAVEVLRGAAASWAEEGRPFVALVRGEKLPKMAEIGG